LSVVRPVERARQKILPHVGAVARELLLRHRLGAADPLAGDRAHRAALAPPVLHGLDLHFLPVLAEAADDAAVPRRLAVAVRPSFPYANRREMRRLLRRGAPLVCRVIRDTVQADLAAAPRLGRRPLDTVVEVTVFTGVVMIEIAGGTTGAARVHAHACVAA